MAYKILGIGLPTTIRNKLRVEGVEFQDFFPSSANSKLGPPFINGLLSLINLQQPATDSELKSLGPEEMKDKKFNVKDLKANIE